MTTVTACGEGRDPGRMGIFRRREGVVGGERKEGSVVRGGPVRVFRFRFWLLFVGGADWADGRFVLSVVFALAEVAVS